MEGRDYLRSATGLIYRAWLLRKRGMGDGVRHANLERELRELNARMDRELFGRAR